jgi:superfamily I DNA/RNA helicase
VLYDDAQSIYDTRRKGRFSFKGVGIQAQGRTTILRVNYRNTDEILSFAAEFTNQLLTQEDADDDNIPRLAPIAAGRRGTKPLLLKLPTIKTEAEKIAELLKEAHHDGMAWKDMAVLYGNEQDRQELYQALVEQKVRFAGKDKISYTSGEDRVSFLSFRVSKGLEFPLVTIMGGRIVEQAKTDTEAAKLLYVAMTRATDHLIMTVAE